MLHEAFPLSVCRVFLTCRRLFLCVCICNVVQCSLLVAMHAFIQCVGPSVGQNVCLLVCPLLFKRECVGGEREFRCQIAREGGGFSNLWKTSVRLVFLGTRSKSARTPNLCKVGGIHVCETQSRGDFIMVAQIRCSVRRPSFFFVLWFRSPVKLKSR